MYVSLINTINVWRKWVPKKKTLSCWNFRIRDQSKDSCSKVITIGCKKLERKREKEKETRESINEISIASPRPTRTWALGGGWPPGLSPPDVRPWPQFFPCLDYDTNIAFQNNFCFLHQLELFKGNNFGEVWVCKILCSNLPLLVASEKMNENLWSFSIIYI